MCRDHNSKASRTSHCITMPLKDSGNATESSTPMGLKRGTGTRCFVSRFSDALNFYGSSVVGIQPVHALPYRMSALGPAFGPSEEPARMRRYMGMPCERITARPPVCTSNRKAYSQISSKLQCSPRAGKNRSKERNRAVSVLPSRIVGVALARADSRQWCARQAAAARHAGRGRPRSRPPHGSPRTF
jgi:hypothetical protein